MKQPALLTHVAYEWQATCKIAAADSTQQSHTCCRAQVGVSDYEQHAKRNVCIHSKPLRLMCIDVMHC